MWNLASDSIFSSGALALAVSVIIESTIKAAILQSGALLGILQQDPEQWFAGETSEIDAQEIDQLIAERAQAKEQGDWGRADEIRDILQAKNVVLEDSASGTRWRVRS